MKYMVQIDNGSGIAPREAWRTITAKRPSAAVAAYLSRYGKQATGMDVLKRGESVKVLVAAKVADNLHDNGVPIYVIGYKVTAAAE
jgi:hypothetical protein